MMRYIKNIILFIWQLPQHIVALIYFGYLVMTCKDLGIDSRYKQAIVIPCIMRGAITLGNYVFVGLDSEYRETVKHELGHTIQSKILGPLYLIVIGMPSITYCGLRRLFPSLRRKCYYNFYPERMANYLSEKYISNL